MCEMIPGNDFCAIAYRIMISSGSITEALEIARGLMDPILTPCQVSTRSSSAWSFSVSKLITDVVSDLSGLVELLENLFAFD
ncbi:unnamed protein product [Mycena citricolor]|uniref:Uncharacterized protein n=1 Tax=Mycena citricolor TaxID=2018698 RepID=A0AAD2HA98_9AGAR|nr:unnamed protein product [Mycena citricolor]